MKKFEKVEPRPDFPKIDEGIISFWRENKVFEETQRRDSRLRGNDPRTTSKCGAGKRKDFVFYEGPPTANGKPGVHHVISRVFKDIIPRFKTMQGYHVDRKGGWDTHGLPVELEVEKQLGFKNKLDIEAYGIEAFNQKCRESVWTYLEDWKEFTRRLGFWIDLDRSYVTYKSDYVESLWWVIKQIWDKGLLYKDYNSPLSQICLM